MNAMTPEFLTNPELGEKIKYVARGKHFRAAVAFWGAEALSIIPDGSNNSVFYCDLLSGSTNPRIIQELGKEKFRHVNNLHAKVYCSENGTVVCSANFSRNGIFNNIEAGVFVKDTNFGRHVFEECEKIGENITDDMMKESYKRWRKRSKNVNSGYKSANNRLIDSTNSQITKLKYEEYAPLLEKEFFTNSNIINEDGLIFKHQFQNTKYEFSITDVPKNRRYLFAIKKNGQRRMLIRTEPKPGKTVSGMIARIEGQLYLFHNPNRVNNKEKRPHLENPREYQGEVWSTFVINSESLATNLLEYELSRPQLSMKVSDG